MERERETGAHVRFNEKTEGRGVPQERRYFTIPSSFTETGWQYRTVENISTEKEAQITRLTHTRNHSLSHHQPCTFSVPAESQ